MLADCLREDPEDIALSHADLGPFNFSYSYTTFRKFSLLRDINYHKFIMPVQNIFLYYLLSYALKL